MTNPNQPYQQQSFQQAPQPGDQLQGYPQQGYPQQAYGPNGYLQQAASAQSGYGYQPHAVQVQPPAGAMAPQQGPVPWAAPKRKRPVALEIVLVIVGGLLASVFVWLMTLMTSGSTVFVAALLGLVPLVMIGAVVLWIDRWEPEPRFLMAGAFLWGGGVAVFVASLLNGVVGVAIGEAVGSDLPPEVAPAVFGAPIVEEAAKGLGILLIFLVRRRQFNGPVDGVVYAALVALGFSVVEDVQYFALNAEDMGSVFFMRALLSPFGHLIYSLPMGIALGYAGRMRSKAAWLWLFPLGYLVGVGLHMAWNGSLTYVSSLGDVLAIFVFLNWLPFVVLAAIVIWLRRRESAVMLTRLRDYVPSGWLTEEEVQGLSSMRACRAARQWAARFGTEAKKSMRDYQRAATRLAYARQDLYTGHAGIRARIDEGDLLNAMARARADVSARAQAAQVR